MAAGGCRAARQRLTRKSWSATGNEGAAFIGVEKRFFLTTISIMALGVTSSAVPLAPYPPLHTSYPPHPPWPCPYVRSFRSDEYLCILFTGLLHDQSAPSLPRRFSRLYQHFPATFLFTHGTGSRTHHHFLRHKPCAAATARFAYAHNARRFRSSAMVLLLSRSSAGLRGRTLVRRMARKRSYKCLDFLAALTRHQHAPGAPPRTPPARLCHRLLIISRVRCDIFSLAFSCSSILLPPCAFLRRSGYITNASRQQNRFFSTKQQTDVHMFRSNVRRVKYLPFWFTFSARHMLML